MALDAALLAAAEAGAAPPTLRVYGFSPPALSLGYGQSEDDVDREACRRLGIDVVRRPTGGRAVLHEHDLTYALVAPLDDPRFPPSVGGTYQVVAEALRDALVALGAREVVLAPRRAAAPDDPACFAAPARAELLLGGRKVAGSAQRRGRRAFLQHGSILLAPDPARLAACLRGADAARLAGAMVGLRSVPGLSALAPEAVAGAVTGALARRLGVRFVAGPGAGPGTRWEAT
jgi:lipoate-protein ligase A